MEVKFDEITKKIQREYEDLKANVEKPNILITGGTGVGKSSLINTVFGKDLAATGVGKPVTKNTQAYADEELSLVLLDTKGYEVGSEEQKNYLNEIVEYAILNRSIPEKSIHLVWYCIQATSARFLDFDEQIIKTLTDNNIPVAVVFTKCDLVSRDDLDMLKGAVCDSLPEVEIFETTMDSSLNHLELNSLINWSLVNLPSALELAFISAQKINLKIKKKKAKNIIIQHTSGAGFVGFTPIPFSDAPALLANQAALFARIIYIYEMNFLYKRLKEFAIGLGLPGLVSKGGVWIAGQLLKFFPGIGTYAGGLITGGIAASITAGIGIGLSETCYKINQKVLDGEIEDVEQFINNVDDEFIKIIKDSVITEAQKFMDKEKEGNN
ncbi:GTPase [Sutcliffiella cohnii]